MADCVFCEIVAEKLPRTVRYETDDVLAFDSNDPKAAVHILVIPKRHIKNLATAAEADDTALAALLPAVRTIAKEQGLSGFKVLSNNGAAFGQSVFHLHLHLLGGHVSSSVLQSL